MFLPKIKASPFVPVVPPFAMHQQDRIALQVKIYALQDHVNAAPLLQHLILKNVKLKLIDVNVPNVFLVTTQPIVENVSYFVRHYTTVVVVAVN